MPATPRNLASTVLLAVSGGILDATVWLLHGHVFATTMTGNTVLLAVALVQGNMQQALQHVVPLVTFTLGIAAGWHLLHRLPQPRRAHRVALLCEVIALAIAGCAPLGFPSVPIVTLIAFAASVQIATFQSLGGVSYNTTFVTGDIRTLVESLYDRAVHPSPAASLKAQNRLRVIAPVCAGFFVGVLLGAFSAPHIGNHTLWIACLLLTFAFVVLE